ncbi:L,D-transpeptidase catalytic domain [Desulfonispora thiosulfatigenes DSM 11270]|uniref:L,D-transpeptidase catalytic domain n=1 Tax=Desulfonispora thiosulfatigenes DSM 11270 TaxID=656914 RepID=A0A1W1VKS9_DESTI|nr:L,D-transpeptidase [Desulfonispora thiosulfatigenes]SMB93928.1 L,D-transpeptidase catalytic domain [Desulfonispora thiosulfatigenes DSM 11270]
MIDTEKKILSYQNDTLVKSFPVGVGHEKSQTPIGTYKIKNKILNPKSYRYNIPSDSYGSAWLGLTIPGYGIHGTNEPSSIGKNKSLGCIRMLNEDILELYKYIKTNTKVIIFTQVR